MKALLLTLLLTGCVAPTDEFARGTPGADPTEESTEGPTNDHWDAAPPPVDSGTDLVAILSCGMLEGDSDVYWSFDGDGWEAVGRVEHPWFSEDEAEQDYGGQPYDLVRDCFTSGAPRDLDWSDDGSFVFYNGNWAHELEPTNTPGFWVGTVRPMFDVSDECLDGMEELGVQAPVGLSLTVLGTTDGSYTFVD